MSDSRYYQDEDPAEMLRKIQERRASLGEQDSPDIVGDEEVIAKQVDNTPRTAAPNPDAGKLTAAGDTVAAGGMMSGNPYVGAAGLVLSTVGKVDDAKRGQEQAKIDMYNKKIMAKRAAVRNLFDD